MGAALNKLLNKFNEFKALPAGKPFSVMITDTEASDAVREYLAENKDQVKKLIKESSGKSLDVEEPSIRFGNDEIALSAKVGKSILKVGASLTADVRWNGKPEVKVRSVDIPIISVTPEKLNSLVEKPLELGMNKVREYAEIRSFKFTNGTAVLDALKK